MKKFLATLAGIAILCTPALSQPFYKFQQSQSAYSSLQNATVITTDLSQNNYSYSISGFKAFDENLPVSVTIGKNGYIVATGLTNSFAFDPFIVDINAIGSTSSILAKTEVAGTETILKIEWKNVTMAGLPPGDYFNFQAWIYKGSQVVEFHYGPSNITTPSSIESFINISLLSPDFNTNYESHTIVGTPAMPEDDMVDGTANVYTGFPANGTVYRFLQQSVGVNETVALNPGIKVYPNPVQDKLSLDGTNGTPYSYTLYDMTGRSISHGTFTGRTTISTVQWPSGVYQLHIRGNGFVDQKVPVIK